MDCTRTWNNFQTINLVNQAIYLAPGINNNCASIVPNNLDITIINEILFNVW